MKIEQLPGVISDNTPLDTHLDTWARYMRRWRASDDVGYPDHSAGFGEAAGGAVCDDTFEHLCDSADAYAARAMEAIIDGLPPDQRAAVYHVHLAAVFRMRDLPGSYERARIAIRQKLAGRGLV
jgi:hypothetical protein